MAIQPILKGIGHKTVQPKRSRVYRTVRRTDEMVTICNDVEFKMRDLLHTFFILMMRLTWPAVAVSIATELRGG